MPIAASVTETMLVTACTQPAGSMLGCAGSEGASQVVTSCQPPGTWMNPPTVESTARIPTGMAIARPHMCGCG